MGADPPDGVAAAVATASLMVQLGARRRVGTVAAKDCLRWVGTGLDQASLHRGRRPWWPADAATEIGSHILRVAIRGVLVWVAESEDLCGVAG
jgi:hypothetical protein